MGLQNKCEIKQVRLDKQEFSVVLCFFIFPCFFGGACWGLKKKKSNVTRWQCRPRFAEKCEQMRSELPIQHPPRSYPRPQKNSFPGVALVWQLCSWNNLVEQERFAILHICIRHANTFGSPLLLSLPESLYPSLLSSPLLCFPFFYPPAVFPCHCSLHSHCLFLCTPAFILLEFNRMASLPISINVFKSLTLLHKHTHMHAQICTNSDTHTHTERAQHLWETQQCGGTEL